MSNTTIPDNEYDELHEEGAKIFGKDWLWINEKIISVCQYYKIDFRKKENIIPFLRIIILVKQINDFK